ncbi:MAG: zinc ribbon domain-containing protein [Candidatus Acidiferrales bacterium]
MSRFREELRVIPRAAWVVGWLFYLGLAAGIQMAIHLELNPDMRSWPLIGQILFTAFVPLFVFIPVLLVGYVNGDAKRRGMRYVMWTLLAIFIPDAIGIILYFILRDPMPASCPRCGEWVPSKYAFCPKCGTAARPTCPQCGKAVEGAWVNCAFCGTKLPVQK